MAARGPPASGSGAQFVQQTAFGSTSGPDRGRTDHSGPGSHRQDADLHTRANSFQKSRADLKRDALIGRFRSAPSLKARPPGSTSLTKTLLFFWPSAYPVTAKPARRIQPEDYIKHHDRNSKHDSPKRARLTQVAAATLPAHVQRKHIRRDHLQLIVDLRGDIKQIDTRYRKSGYMKRSRGIVRVSSPHHGRALRGPRIEPPRAAPLACAVGGSARPGPAVSPVYTGASKCLADGTKIIPHISAPVLRHTAAVWPEVAITLPM